MIMMTFKISRKKLMLSLVAIALLATGGFFLKETFSPMISETILSISKKNDAKKMLNAPAKTNEDRLAFIGLFGWEVHEEPVEVLEVLVPEEFDDVYNNYNTLQKKQGYDLTKYQGKRCKRYTYEITNYPEGATGVKINILVYKNKVIGGDVCSAEVNGFMHGFDITTAATLAPGGEEVTVSADGTAMVVEGEESSAGPADQPEQAAQTGAAPDQLPQQTDSAGEAVSTAD